MVEPLAGLEVEDAEPRHPRLVGGERQLAEAVAAARAAGLTWKHIGEQIGVSAQGAQQRYGTLVTPA